MEGIDGIILPGGESTATCLIGTRDGMWTALKKFIHSGKPTWGTCAGMILLAERCIGASAVIENGQSLIIDGLDILVCRNYFGSQISSFEMSIPLPPGHEDGGDYSGAFIRAPVILTVGEGMEVLGKVVATPCRQAAVVLRELENKIAAGEDVVMMNVVDALERTSGIKYVEVKWGSTESSNDKSEQEEKKESTLTEEKMVVELPGAADGSNA